MSRSLGGALPPALLERLSQRELGPRLGFALPFVTLDAAGRPHPMLLSYLEVRARNLVERTAGTLLIVEPDAVMYVKTRAVDGPLEVADDPGLGLGYFLLAVEEVLEDAAAEWEGGMRITGAIQYRPTPSLEADWARATLAALASPRARA